ncbi:MAG: hypothetical protein AAF297_00320 [Planctomycetota bacterium]
MRTVLAPFIASLLATSLAGCRAPETPRTFTFAAADYPRVFEITQETIRDYRFDLARIDARSGIITTDLKPTAGLATPGDLEQQTLGQEWQDLVNDQLREVRVWFRKTDTDAGSAAPDGTSPGPALRPQSDLTQARPDETVEATIEVTIHRRRYPGKQVETERVSTSRNWQSRQLSQRQLRNATPIPLRRDDDFAKRLSERITRSLESDAESRATTED